LIDYLIIGQGIAGTMLAYFFEKKGIPFKIVDAVDYSLSNSKSKFSQNQWTHPFHGASNVSTGIINPVTGRRFVKSWMIDTLFPFAEKTYQAIEKKLQISFYNKTNLYRTVPDQKAMNDFLLRLDDPAYQSFFSDDTNFKPNPKCINIIKKGIVIKKAAKINVPYFLQHYRNYLIKTSTFINANLNYNRIRTHNNYYEVTFSNEKIGQFKQLVFCEGYRVKDNPFFNFLPFTGSNGQTLIIESSQLVLNYLLKSGVFVIPIGNQKYQIGTTWDWDINEPKTTAAGYDKLLSKLNTLIKVPFTITDHQAAVRPTIKDRRPVMGRHPNYPGVFLFNAFGSKGVSLSPYFAQHFVQFLLEETPLMKEVSIERFIS